MKIFIFKESIQTISGFLNPLNFFYGKRVFWGFQPSSLGRRVLFILSASIFRFLQYSLDFVYLSLVILFSSWAGMDQLFKFFKFINCCSMNSFIVMVHYVY